MPHFALHADYAYIELALSVCSFWDSIRGFIQTPQAKLSRIPCDAFKGIYNHQLAMQALVSRFEVKAYHSFPTRRNTC